MGRDNGGYPSGKAEKLTPPPKSACRPTSTCACSATKRGTDATASTEDREGGYVQGPGPVDDDTVSVLITSKDPFTQDILTATAFINQVLRKAGLDPSDVCSITLGAGFRATVLVYVRDAHGVPVYDEHSKNYELSQVDVDVLWDVNGLKGFGNGTGDDSGS